MLIRADDVLEFLLVRVLSVLVERVRLRLAHQLLVLLGDDLVSRRYLDCFARVWHRVLGLVVDLLPRVAFKHWFVHRFLKLQVWRELQILTLKFYSLTFITCVH